MDRADYNVLHEDIKLGRNYSWEQYSLTGLTIWGPGIGGAYYRIDDSDTANPIITMGSKTKFLRQYFKYVRSRAERIEAVSNNTAFDPLAFVNTDGKYVIVVKAASGGSFNILGLPSTTYGIKYTTSNQYDVDLPNVSIVTGQPLTTAMPEAGVITIYAAGFPGSLSAFQAIMPGLGSVAVDVVDDGIGLQGFTLMSASNANVSIAVFPPGWTGPVTATFTVPDTGQEVDFTLRASQRSDAVMIRAQCGS